MLKIKTKGALGSQRNYNWVKFQSGKGWVPTYLVGVPITICQKECQWPGPFKRFRLLSKLLSLCHKRCHADLWEGTMKIEDISKRSCDYSMAPFNILHCLFHLIGMGTFPSRHLRVTHFVLRFSYVRNRPAHRTDCNWKTDSAQTETIDVWCSKAFTPGKNQLLWQKSNSCFSPTHPHSYF